jgi:hypothetical protein
VKFSLGIEGALLSKIKALVLAGLAITIDLQVFLATLSSAWP